MILRSLFDIQIRVELLFVALSLEMPCDMFVCDQQWACSVHVQSVLCFDVAVLAVVQRFVPFSWGRLR